MTTRCSSGPPKGAEDGDDRSAAGAVTVGETLQGAGYATGYVGKFHVADEPRRDRAEHGFDENFGGSHAGNATASTSPATGSSTTTSAP